MLEHQVWTEGNGGKIWR